MKLAKKTMQIAIMKDVVFIPLTRLLPSWLHPNHLSVLRGLFTLPVGWLLWSGDYLWGGIIFFLAFALDGIDGTLARSTNRITPLGMIIDPVADKLLFLTAFTIVGVQRAGMWLLGATISVELGILLISLILALFTKWRGKPYIRGANAWGKAKTALQVPGIILLLPSATVTLGSFLLWVGVGLAVINLVKNVRDGVGVLRG